jgi:hypothetical protein
LTANECRVSLGADENILKLAVMHAQHCEYATKINLIIDFEGSILCYMTMLLLKKDLNRSTEQEVKPQFKSQFHMYNKSQHQSASLFFSVRWR